MPKAIADFYETSSADMETKVVHMSEKVGGM